MDTAPDVGPSTIPAKSRGDRAPAGRPEVLRVGNQRQRQARPAGRMAAPERGDTSTTMRRSLRVGAADDAYERQADATAAQVMRRLAGQDEMAESVPEATGTSGVAVLQRRRAADGAMGAE